MQYVTFVYGAASSLNWLFGGNNHDRSHMELKALPVCALFALIPALPEGTRLGINKKNIVVIQPVNEIATIPGTKQKITGQSLERSWNGDSKEDTTLFNQAVKKIVEQSGGDPLTKSLLTRTAEGLGVYSNVYPKNSTARSTLENLSSLILKELEDPEKSKGSPIEQDRMQALVSMIDHVYDRVTRKVAYAAELSAALAYINGLQLNDENPLRQNQQVEVPT